MLEGAVSMSKIEGKAEEPWLEWLAGYQRCDVKRPELLCFNAGTREMDREDESWT